MTKIFNNNKPNRLLGPPSAEGKENWHNFMELNLFPNSGDSVGADRLVHLIKYPIITLKSLIALVRYQQYTFDVDLRLSKPQIKKIFENLYNVNVIAINTHIPPRKNCRIGITQGYQVRYKRAILTLEKGKSFDFSVPLTKVAIK